MDRFRFGVACAVTAALSLLVATATVVTSVRAEVVVVRGATMYTLDPAAPVVQAAVIVDGRVAYRGDAAGAQRYVDRGARVIEVKPGWIVLPGLTDAHGHLRSLGRSLATVRLVGTRSREECAARVREAAGHAAPGQWIRGRGWDQNDWKVEAFPTWRDLSGTESHPVLLTRVDGHAVWVNRTALDLAGIARDTPDPDGGHIVRDANGEPTGVLVDNATDLVEGLIPEPTDDELDGWMRAAVSHCAEAGLTGVHDAGEGTRAIASLRRLAHAGELPIRVYCMLDGTDDALLDTWFAKGPTVEDDGRFTIRAVKLYADGALGSRGAALSAPYSDDPGNTGLLTTRPSRLDSVATRAAAAGFQTCIHAIGDRGNRVALDAIEHALAAHPGDDRRFRIEHCQVVQPDDIARFVRLGVVASMQPTHATSDMYWAEERLGPERVTWGYAWRTFLDAGVPLAFGSDFPVEDVSPWAGLYAAVTRQDAKGWPEGGWFPEQRLTIDEALAAFTTGAAYAAFEERELGRIAEGMRGDLVVVDRDVVAAARGGHPEALLAAHVVYTIVGGDVVYESVP